VTVYILNKNICRQNMRHKLFIIKNKDHSIRTEYFSIIDEFRNKITPTDMELINAPVNGWNIKQMNMVVIKIKEESYNYDKITVIFISPIPYLIREISMLSGQNNKFDVKLFHHDKRVKSVYNGRYVQKIRNSKIELV